MDTYETIKSHQNECNTQVPRPVPTINIQPRLYQLRLDLPGDHLLGVGPKRDWRG